jgi:hypothetical protein
MNLNEIKEIIHKEGGKIVIVENDEPQLIIMSYEEYKGKNKTQGRSSPMQVQSFPSSPNFTPPPPRVERQGPQINPYSPPRPEGDQGEGLTIDDLPL